MSEYDQSRVILWAPPRSLSTAFLKCITGVPDSKMFYEPFISAYQFGPNRIIGDDMSLYYPEDLPLEKHTDSGSSEFVFDDSMCTYKFVQQLLEDRYPGKQLIFAKDMMHSLAGKYELIPRGYRHIFLIRNPVKVFPSWCAMIQEITSVRKGTHFDEMPLDVMPSGLSFKEGFELFIHIKDTKLDPDPVIIDADDLLQSPDVILQACCKRVGIPYTDDLLSWKDDDNMADAWTATRAMKHILKRNVACFRTLKRSRGFGGPWSKSGGPSSPDELPVDLKRCVDTVMPYYRAMHDNRLTIQDCNSRIFSATPFPKT